MNDHLTDLSIIDALEKAQAALDSILSDLEVKYSARVSTPYLAENIDDVRKAIKKASE